MWSTIHDPCRLFGKDDADLGARANVECQIAAATASKRDDAFAIDGPFQANAGTYELSGSTLTLRLIVSKNPNDQRENNFARPSVKMDGNRL